MVFVFEIFSFFSLLGFFVYGGFDFGVARMFLGVFFLFFVSWLF